MHDREQNDRAEQRDQQRAKREAAREDGRHAKQWRQNKPCQKRADDPDNDIQEDALLRIRPHHKTGKPAQYASQDRSDEHTSELQSLMRISYALFYTKKKTQKILANQYSLKQL